VIAVGRIEPEVGESMIREGKADVIAMARKLLADPELAKKLVEGREKDVRPCIYCYTCVAQPFFDLPVRCAVNPVTGNEHTLGRKAAEAAAVPRRVLVVGGGPAGLEAARLARLRGHEVVLCEKSAQLGGTLRFAALVYEPNEHLLDWLARQVERVGVDVRLRTEVTPELVREIAPDLVLVAAGARRQRPAIPGVDRDHVFDGEDLRSLLTGQGEARSTEKLSVFGRLAVRAGRAVGLTSSPSMLREASKAWMPLGREVVIVGGGLVGLELAEFLAERGRRVTVLEEEAKLGLEMAHPRRWRILDDLRERGVELVPQARVRSIEPDAVAAELTSAKGEVLARSFPADTVVLAVGLEPNPAITASLEGVGVPIREIGDVAGVGYLEGAIRDGFHAALEI
jgi:2,4-dienoyl-CoA reductase (NADPH2)